MTSDTSSGLMKGRLPNWSPAVPVAAAFIIFAAAQLSINSVNGWWSDELYALWASDIAAPFSDVFAERIYPDTNPPLYFSLLYLARLLISGDRAAVLALNIGFLVAAGASVLLISRPARLVGLAAISVAAFVLSGPVLTYTAEGRAYLAALAVAFVAAWCVALAVERRDDRPSLPVFAALGALGALVHVYSALFCGTLAAGLLILALWNSSRRDLILPAVALGAAASVALVAWLLTITGSLGRVDWMEFSRATVVGAAWYVKEITVGPRLLGLLLIFLLLLGLFQKKTRPIVMVFGIAFGLFIALPLVISLKKPMISGRYWVIGAPGIIVLLAFLARAWWSQLADRGILSWPAAAVAGAIALAVATSISGFVTAREFVATKPTWKGAEIARPLLGGCPPASVHVGRGKIEGGDASIHAFSKVGEVPAAVFIDAGYASTQPLTPSGARCPVLGWAEHVLLGDGFPSRAPESELLRVLKIQAEPGEIVVHRHRTGFVLLKRP